MPGKALARSKTRRFTMLSKLKLPLAALVISFATLANANTGSGTDLERLLDVSGINSSIASIPKSIDDEMSVEV